MVFSFVKLLDQIQTILLPFAVYLDKFKRCDNISYKRKMFQSKNDKIQHKIMGLLPRRIRHKMGLYILNGLYVVGGVCIIVGLIDLLYFDNCSLSHFSLIYYSR